MHLSQMPTQDLGGFGRKTLKRQRIDYVAGRLTKHTTAHGVWSFAHAITSGPPPELVNSAPLELPKVPPRASTPTGALARPPPPDDKSAWENLCPRVVSFAPQDANALPACPPAGDEPSEARLTPELPGEGDRDFNPERGADPEPN